MLSSTVKSTSRNVGSVPNASRTGVSGRVNAPVAGRSWPVSGPNAAGGRGGGAKGVVRGDVVRWVVGGRQDGDAEPLEQGARAERVLGECVRELVVQGVGVGGRGLLGEPEHVVELRLEPEPHRRAQ